MKELKYAISSYPGCSHECLDDFRDGPYGWEPVKINSIACQKASKFNASVIVTFDFFGVSGHRNHKSCSVITVPENEKVRVLYLESISIFRKFWATLDLIPTCLGPKPFVVAGSWRSVRAMYYHKSQLVWFRALYIVFSRYMTINSFRTKCN